MYDNLRRLFNILNGGDNHIVIMTVYISLFALALLLRVITSVTFRSSLFALRLDSKEIKKKDDIRNIRHGMTRKIAADYINIAERDISRIPTAAVVEHALSAMSLLGWRFTGVMALVESLEGGLVFVGLILAVVFGDFSILYGMIAVCGFVLTRLAVAFLDFRTLRRQYADELLIYAEREIGRFYPVDAGGAVLRLKTDMTDSVAKLSAALTASINQLGENFAGAVDKKLLDMNEALSKTTKDWETALAEAAKTQGLFNASAEKMQISGANIMSASDLLSRHMHGHSNALSEQLGALVSAVDAAKESNRLFTQEMDAMLKQSQYIETNQRALDAALQSYEATLKDLTRQMGDGFGAYLKLHAQDAAKSVSSSLSEAIETVVRNNHETLTRMGALFDQLREQNREVSASLLALHEKANERRGGGALI